MASADEHQPLLRPIVEGVQGDLAHHEIMLDFEAGDAENPREWAAPYHWSIVLLLASMAFTVYVNCFRRLPHANKLAHIRAGLLLALASCR